MHSKWSADAGQHTSGVQSDKIDWKHTARERAENGLKLIWPISIPQHYHRQRAAFLIRRRFAIAIGFCAWITSLLAVLSHAVLSVLDVCFVSSCLLGNPTDLYVNNALLMKIDILSMANNSSFTIINVIKI